MQRKLFHKAARGFKGGIGVRPNRPDVFSTRHRPTWSSTSRSWRGRQSRCRSSLPRLLTRRSRHASAREKMGSWPRRRCSGGPAVAPKVGVWGLLLATTLRLELTGGPGARRRAERVPGGDARHKEEAISSTVDLCGSGNGRGRFCPALIRFFVRILR